MAPKSPLKKLFKFMQIGAWVVLVVLLPLLVGLWASQTALCSDGALSDASAVMGALSPTRASAIVKSIGLGMDYRSYEPATTLDSLIGASLGVEVSLVQPPSDLISSIQGISSDTVGATSGQSALVIPVLPSLKIHAHKSIGPRFELGFTMMPPLSLVAAVKGTFLYGGEVKIVVFLPEEGPTWAIRTSYNYNNITINTDDLGLTIKTSTFTPQIVVSQKLTFAEPYVGSAVQYTTGSVKVSVNIPSPEGYTVAPITVVQSGSGWGMYFFGGLDLKMPDAGVRLVIEGAYSPLGMNALGVKIGFLF